MSFSMGAMRSSISVKALDVYRKASLSSRRWEARKALRRSWMEIGGKDSRVEMRCTSGGSSELCY